MPEGPPLRAYEGMRLANSYSACPRSASQGHRKDLWAYDRALYIKRNEIERLVRRLKGFRSIFSRLEKLDVLFLGFLNFALIVEALR
jgi:transposase